MDMMTLSVVALVIMIVMVLSGMQVGLSMAIVGFVGLIVAKDFNIAMSVLRTVPSNIASSYVFTVIPLFILMGHAAYKAGISDGLFDSANKWLSRLPGNIACASTVTCATFSAICGSQLATTATVGTIVLPKMFSEGYSKRLAAGVVSVSGGIGMLIPPSTVMIVYGVATENSIGKLFAAGVFPGILLGIVILMQIQLIILTDRSVAPRGYKCSWGERIKSLKNLWAIVILFVVVLVGMFSGFYTVNEAAAVGAFFAILLMAIKGKLNWQNLKDILRDTVSISGMIFILIIGGTIFGHFLTHTRMPMHLANFIAGLEVNRYIILTCIFLIYVVLGAMMDEMPMIMLTVPIFYPIMMNLGFDPIWFGVFIMLVCCIGVICPPVGINCYVVAGLFKELPLSTVYRGAVPFLAAITVVAIIITALPQIATWLPNVLYG